MIREEKAVYGQISDEEWEAIRPTKRERKDTILNFMRGYLKDNSKCSNCTTWRMQSGESWGNVYDTKFSSICKYLKNIVYTRTNFSNRFNSLVAITT